MLEGAQAYHEVVRLDELVALPAPLQPGQAPSELALNSAGLTPLAFANALRIGSSIPVYVAGLLRREPRMAPWSITTTPSQPATEPWIRELLPDRPRR